MTNTILWILQFFIAFAFLYSGVCKSYFPLSKLVAMGQTGVDGLPIWFVRFIGVSEILGAIGIIIPWWLSIYPVLTPLSSICFAFIMPFAAVIHYKRREPKNVLTNVVFFILCAFVAVARFAEV